MSAFQTNAIDRSSEHPRIAFQLALPATDRMIYEAPATSAVTLTQVVFCNTTASSATVRLHSVPPNGTVGTANALLYNIAIPSGCTLVYDTPVHLRAGEMVFARCSTASAITATGYVEVI